MFTVYRTATDNTLSAVWVWSQSELAAFRGTQHLSVGPEELSVLLLFPESQS